MDTLIIGGGLMGITTAYQLLKKGESVTILECREGVALETSYANGGMLTPSMSEPWNSPGVYKYLAASVFNPVSTMKLRLRAVPSLFFWGIKFLKYSSEAHFRSTCRDNFFLASYSLQETQKISENLDLKYFRGANGTLSVFRNHEDFSIKESVCQHLANLGMKYDILTPNEIISMVPALNDIKSEIYNGILYQEDQHGDAHLFCKQLLDEYINAGGHIEYDVNVSSLRTKSNRIIGVDTANGFRVANRVVVTAGTRSPALLKSVGIHLGVKPVKGYSVTVDVTGIKDIPILPVLDDSMHAGITPLGHHLRMVGTAEFAGFDTSINNVRTGNLYTMFESMLPSIAAQVERKASKPWAGLRPMSYDGKPFIGSCDVEGLYINCGHGALGWTMAMGSASLLSDIVSGNRPEINDLPFSLNRKKRRVSSF